MPLPNTPLVSNIANQIDKEIKAFLQGENLRYMEASPENLTMINDKLRDHFHTDGIEAKYSSSAPWERKMINISISDSYVLTRLKAINESEYSRVTIWMGINGYAVPPIEVDAYMYLTGQTSGAASRSCLQLFDGSEDTAKKTMGDAFLRAERDRQQFIRDHLATFEASQPEITDSGVLTIHDDQQSPMNMKKDKMPSQGSCLTVHGGDASMPWTKATSPTYISPAKTIKKSNDTLTIY